MEGIPKGIYTQEFREQAVRLHEVDGLTIPEVAKRLSLPAGTLKNWVYAARRGKLGEVGKNQKPLTDLEMERARVGGSQDGARSAKKSGGLLCEGREKRRLSRCSTVEGKHCDNLIRSRC